MLNLAFYNMLSTTLGRSTDQHRASVDIDSQSVQLLGTPGSRRRFRSDDINTRENAKRLLLRGERPLFARRPKRESGTRIRVNISGKIFDTYHTTLKCKKGSIFNLDNVWNYYDRARGEFFFERDPRSFEAIFIYMQCGLIVKPDKVPYKVFIENLQFFGFEELASKLYNEEVAILRPPTYDPKKVLGFKNTLWHMLEYPNATKHSRWLNLWTTLVIFIATTLLCFESIPSIFIGQNIHNIQCVEVFCVAWYTLETIVKFAISSKKLKFFTVTSNMMDLLSILPFYIYLLKSNTYMFKGSLLRVFRLSKGIGSMGFSNCEKILHITVISMESCLKETLGLVSIFGITAILFSTVIYYVENERGDFDSIPSIMWFCFVTMTSVGYGDMYPETIAGKLVSSCIVGGSILVIALPLPVIIGNFLRNYMRTKNDKSVDFTFDDTISTFVENEKRRKPSPRENLPLQHQPFYLRCRTRHLRLLVTDRPVSDGCQFLQVPGQNEQRPLSMAA